MIALKLQAVSHNITHPIIADRLYSVLFPFLVNCVVMQKTGAGLHTAMSCYWDNNTDGSCTIKWENKTMYCIVTVFGLAI